MKYIYKIEDGCITCGRCERNCPKEAIMAGPKHYEIEQEKCIGCGTCAMLCPMGVISREEKA